MVVNSFVFMTAACANWREWSFFLTCTAMPLLVVYKSFVFHQPCLVGASCLPYVVGTTFTWNIVDNTLHIMFVWLFFDPHQSLSDYRLHLENCSDIQGTQTICDGDRLLTPMGTICSHKDRNLPAKLMEDPGGVDN